MESAELLKRLRAAICCQPEEVPAGWRTAAQYASEWKISATAASVLLSRSLRAGAVEKRSFRIKTFGRGIYPTPHYRPKLTQ